MAPGRSIRLRGGSGALPAVRCDVSAKSAIRGRMIIKGPRVLLADDHTLLLEAFRNLLEPEFEIVGAVEDGRALLSAAAKLNPNIILLDISMRLLNGLEAARWLRKHRPHIKVIFLTMHADPTYECVREPDLA